MRIGGQWVIGTYTDQHCSDTRCRQGILSRFAQLMDPIGAPPRVARQIGGAEGLVARQRSMLDQVPASRAITFDPTDVKIPLTSSSAAPDAIAATREPANVVNALAFVPSSSRI